ncbi:fungal-specific transcription factor domain-containing protein [Mycena haematopus]|nr:fungal-specific transcription factor domain-containing protein [Mycena haematopus]
MPKRSYVDSLEARLERSEAQVQQLRAELANNYFANTSSNIPLKQLNSTAQAEKTTGSPEPFDGLNVSLYVMRTALRVIGAPPPPPHADDLEHLELAENFKKISLTPRVHPFMGKSSGAALLSAAMDLKADIKREEREEALGHSHQPTVDQPVRTDREPEAVTWNCRRLEYWTWRPAVNSVAPRAPFKFPPEVLMQQLVDLYFTCHNIYVPVLHRPTFERGITEGLHLRDDGFAATVLVVCAIGSRWSLDPRMAEKGITCGWEWFEQVAQIKDPFFGQTGLYDLQYYCLTAQFLYGSTGLHASWTFIGVGLRLAQDIGLHRRKARIEVPSVERELFKRAFWVLVCLDRIVSAGMGRACALQYEDFDIDQLLEVDDEYWEHPTHPFQQPPGIPSRVAYFNAYIHLNHILAFSLKTLYSLNKMPSLFSSFEDWDEHAVPELDSALNRWHQKIPDHLRWDPARKHPVFFAQSVALHCAYYNLRILIHRPLIPMLRKSTLKHQLKGPTLAGELYKCRQGMCDDSGLSRRRTGNAPVVINLSAAFTSAIVLAECVERETDGTSAGPEPRMANVYKCMELCGCVRAGGKGHPAELASVGQLKLPNWFSDTCRAQGPRMSTRRTLHHGTLTPHPCHEQRNSTFPSESKSTSSFPALGAETFGDGLMEPSIFAPPPPAPGAWFPPTDTFADVYTLNPAKAEPQDSILNMIDSDTIAMWTNAPRGLEVDDWGAYFLNFSEITQGQADVGLIVNGNYACQS